MIWLLVAVGGAVGSTLRFAAGQLAATFLGPDTVLGTFAVNIIGSFALGFLAALFVTRLAPIPLELRAMATVGLLGGFTTFSTLAYDGVRLMLAGDYARAALVVSANVVVGLAAAFLGILAGRAV